MSKGDDKIVIGYNYKMGIHYIFCQDGITNVRRINLAKAVLWEGNETANTTLSIADDGFFGGQPPAGSGGFSADIDLEFGADTQTANTYIKNTLHGGSDLVPAYRGRFGMVFKSANWGNTGSAAPVSVLCSGDGGVDWYNGKKWVTVTGAEFTEMNPIHMVYYWLTSNRNGLGLGSSQIDADTSSSTFKDAADLCYDEGLGLSFLFSGDNTVQQNIQEILNHIDGSLYQDPSDGLFKIKLARDDYTVATLTTLDDSNSYTMEILDTSFDELVNHAIIEYYDTTTNLINHVDITDLGLREAMGGYTVSKTIRYNGCNSRDLALKLGTRDMLALSRPLKRVKIAANREAGELRPNDVIKWTNADEGVTDMLLRVRQVKKGGLKDRKIELDCIEDVFAYGTVVYSASNPESWIDPSTVLPADLSIVYLMETPYWLYYYKIGGIPTDAASGDGTVTCLSLKDNSAYQWFEIYEKLSTEATYEKGFNLGQFCPFGYLDSSGITYDMISGGAVTVTLQDASQLADVVIGSAAYVNGEIMRVDAVDSDTSEVTLSVGCADTVSKEHAANSVVLFFGYHGGLVGDSYTDGNTVNIKLLPQAPYKRLAEADATANNVTMDSRFEKPYPPAKLRLNGAFYPEAIMGILTVTWAQRNRVTQDSELYDEADGDITHETGTNYELVGYNENGSQVWLADTPSTSLTWDYEDADSGLTDEAGQDRFNNQIRLRLWSTRDGYTSHQEHDFTFDRADYGYSYGKYYGGY